MMTERQKYVIVVAGGSGTRMGAGTPKQFLLLGGVPILQRTIERFAQAEPGIRVVTVLPRSWREEWQNLCIRHGFNVPQILADGGITRFHSVQNALAKVPDGALVAVHDGVRPLVSAELIRRMFAAMESAGSSGQSTGSLSQAPGQPFATQSVRALVPVLPVTDTLKNRDPEGPDPDRSGIVAVQTPQVFRSEELRAAYGSLGFREDFTDDASVAKAYKIPLSYIEGERYNLKITTPEDLRLAELLLKE